MIHNIIHLSYIETKHLCAHRTGRSQRKGAGKGRGQRQWAGPVDTSDKIPQGGKLFSFPAHITLLLSYSNARFDGNVSFTRV